MSIPPQGNSATAIVEAGTAVAGAAANTVLYVDAAGLLASEAAFTYDESSDTLTALNIVASTTLKASNLTATRIPYATTGGQFTDDSTFTFTAASDLVTVDKLTVTTGPVILPDGSGATPSWRFTSSNNGVYMSGGAFVFAFSSVGALVLRNDFLHMKSSSPLGWSSSGVDDTSDVRLYRDAASTLALRVGTAAQEFRYYGSSTDATNYIYGALRVLKTTCSAVSGATVTATGAIPARSGEFVVGIATKVSTALGTGNGTTGYTVGDGSDADRWGSVTGTATTTSTDRDNYTAAAKPAFSTSAADVVLTALGGNFDGTGAIDVYVFYYDVQAD